MMQKILIAAAVASLMVAVALAKAEQGTKAPLVEIQWWTNFDETLKKAKTEGKPILAEFFNPN